jgi:hypothetical protein
LLQAIQIKFQLETWKLWPKGKFLHLLLLTDGTNPACFPSYVEMLIGNDKARYDDFCPGANDKDCAKTVLADSQQIMNVVASLYNNPQKPATNMFNPPVEMRLSAQIIFLTGVGVFLKSQRKRTYRTFNLGSLGTARQRL